MKKFLFIISFFLLNILVLAGQSYPDLTSDSLTQRLSMKVKSIEKENILLDRQLIVLKKQDKAIFDSLEIQKFYLQNQITNLNIKFDSLIIQDSLQKEKIQDVKLSLWKKIEDQQKSWLTIFIILIIVLTIFFTGFFYRDYLLEKQFKDGLSEQRNKTNSKLKRLKTELIKMLKKKRDLKKK
jgi:hypothetical protein